MDKSVLLTPMTRRENLWVGAFALFALILRIPLAFRPPVGIARTYGDDAFYVLSVARNLAAGLGLTVDGHHLTNGFQPLIVLLYTPFFWLSGGDPWLAVRWTVVLNGLIAAASVVVVASVAHAISGAKSQRQFTAPIIAAFLWSCSISLFHQTMNGLETSLYSLCLLGVLWWYIERPHYPVILGVLLGLATLARIDAALLAAIIVAFDFWHRRYQSGAVIGLMAFLISSPWWIYNVLYFGSMMPTSGQAGQVWPSQIQDSISRLIQTLENIALVLGYLPDGLTLTERILAGLAIGAGILLVVWKTRVRQRLQESISVHKFLPFALFCGVLAIYYTFFFHFPHFITRYLQPLRILWLVLVAISLPAILDAYAEATSIRRHVVGTLAAIFLLGSLAFCVNRYWAVYDKSRQMEFYDMGQWAANHPTDKIGMLQSGLASFISPNVINLDGKVNAEALTTHIAGRLPRYIRNEKILYIADWKPFIEDVSDMCRRDELFFDSIGMVGRIQIMKRRDGITNEEVRITN